MNRTGTPPAGKKGSKKSTKSSPSKQPSGYSTPSRPVDQLESDMIAFNLKEPSQNVPEIEPEEPPKISLSREKVLEEAKKAASGQAGMKPTVSIVVIGKVFLLAIGIADLG